MTLPKTFKQAVFKSAGAPLAIEEVTLTPPGAGEILVKVEACGVCFSDMFAQNNILGGGLCVSLLSAGLDMLADPSGQSDCPGPRVRWPGCGPWRRCGRMGSGRSDWRGMAWWS